MKILPAKVWLIALGVLFVMAAALWMRRGGVGSSGALATAEPLPETPTQRPSADLPARPVNPPGPAGAASIAPASGAFIASGWQAGAQAEFSAFRRWTEQYRQATPAVRMQLLPDGLKLARARRVALAQLIRTDPRAALAAAVPPEVRAQLPAEIEALLEERVSGEGELALNAVTPLPGEQPETPVFRSAPDWSGACERASASRHEHSRLARRLASAAFIPTRAHRGRVGVASAAS